MITPIIRRTCSFQKPTTPCATPRMPTSGIKRRGRMNCSWPTCSLLSARASFRRASRSRRDSKICFTSGQARGSFFADGIFQPRRMAGERIPIRHSLDNMAHSLNGFQYSDPGWRPNNDIQNSDFSAQVKYQIDPKDTIFSFRSKAHRGGCGRCSGTLRLQRQPRPVRTMN